MDILVIGSGGREHAIIRKLKQSKNAGKIFAAPGNGGISADAVCVDIKATDVDAVVKFAKENKIGYVVVTPDDPLVLGMVDALNKEGIMAFGPTKAAAAIEGSKVFSKNLMKKYKIPTAAYETFCSSDDAVRYIKENSKYPLVIKADGLALGKGVIIAEDEEQAIAAVGSMMEDRIFGDSGSNIVIEEFLTGIEVSVLAFTDGVSMIPMASSMDHKRVYDGDKGPNTGGMGTIAPHPLYSEDVAKRCMSEIFIPTMNAMNTEGRTFRGCLYFGLILCEDGPKVIEYNCRFGDPETQVVLELLDGDLLDIMLAATNGSLCEADVKTKQGAAACVIIASGGYPAEYKKGYEISGLDSFGQADGATVYHAGTTCLNGKYLSNGGRVLGVTALGGTLQQAIDNAYEKVSKISFKDCYYRSDIGKKVLELS